MAFSTTPRVILSGVRSGVGKTLLTIGLTHELRRRGVSVSCGVIGAQLINSVLLKRLSGRSVRCFDDRLLTAHQNLASFSQAGLGADLVLIDGRAALYDGYAPGTLRGSDAEIARLLRAPVVLIADARGIGTSLVALYKGFSALAEGFEIAGMVLNRYERSNSGEEPSFDTRDREYYEAALEAFRIPPLLGALPDANFPCNVPQEGVLQERNQVALPRQFFIELGALVNRCVNIDALLERAATAPPLSIPEAEIAPSGRRVRIAVSDDSCFHLCFQDNLDLLRYFGAELIPFSPLADSALPKRIGGVYLNGAYLKEYGADIAANESMKEALRSFVDKGGVLYAEGSGCAYLCKEFRVSGTPQVYGGVGVLDGTAISAPFAPRYDDVVTVDDTILGRTGYLVKGFSTNEWRLDQLDQAGLYRSLRFSMPGGGVLHEGFSPRPQVLGTFSFLQFASNPEVAKNLVDSAEVVEKLQ